MLLPRLAFAAGLVALFLVIGVSHPQAQANITDYCYAYHGPGYAFLSRIWTAGPTVDEFRDAAATGQSMYALAAHPSLMNPSTLLGISPGGGGVFRIGPGSGIPIGQTGTTCTPQGACYVNVPPLNPHYLVVGKYPSGGAYDFYDANANNIAETFVHVGTGYEPTACAFWKTTSGPGAPYYRWVRTDKNSTGSSGDTMFFIDFRDADVKIAGGAQNPWDPQPGNTEYGPPFPSFSTQIGGTGATGQTWAGKFFSQGFGGNDDDSHRVLIWTDTAGLGGPAGANYLILARNELLSPAPPTFGASFSVFKADTASFPLAAAGIPAWISDTAGFPDVFQDAKVIGNYLFATTGSNGPTGKGGRTLKAWWLPRLASGPPGPPSAPDAPARRGSWSFDGCTGIWANFLRDKVYVGGDDSHNQYAVCPVDPATAGLMADSNPALLGIATYLALTVAEQSMITPPDRKWVGNDGICPREDPNSFPGTGFGSGGGGRRGKGGACSGAILGDGTGGPIGAIALMLVLFGLATATIREAAKRT